MRIYTKGGDNGETGLIGGSRVSKDDMRICAIGEIDELNASLGILQTYKKTPILQTIQNDLFNIGAELAGGKSTISESHVKALEIAIDAIESNLPELKHFIIPGGTQFSAHAHMSRAICRRAERSVVSLHIKSPLNIHIIEYLNRLSDLLFVLAREEVYKEGQEETLWNVQ